MENNLSILVVGSDDIINSFVVPSKNLKITIDTRLSSLTTTDSHRSLAFVQLLLSPNPTQLPTSYSSPSLRILI